MTLSLALVAAAVGIAAGDRYGRPRTVAQFPVTSGPLDIETRGPGTLDALGKATISARTQGRLSDVLVDRGDYVAPGTLIATIAADDLASQLDAATASHQAAAHVVTQAIAERERSDAALSNARSTHARKSALLRQGWANRADYDAALAAQRQAEAEFARAGAAVDAAIAQEKAAAATVRVAEAQIEETIVRAPFFGIVVSRDRNPGDLMTPGAPIVQIVDPSTLVLTARFDESVMATVRPGQASHVRFSAQPDRPIAGRILRLGRQVDVETREFTVDITLEERPLNWAIGQRGTATVVTGVHRQALSVPEQAIVRRDGKPGLWVARGGRARWRPVELGESGGRHVEIRAGISNGDTVLAPDGAFEGMRVRGTETTR
ncbi:efflux RND transporter periplasmic adaptor subunit [Reyranella sp.]|uniref:efflux RND transporter periplasmic adaptor subunit n=1 Tax=Reyranella sp. TaxID=1929291 RepID=UPI003BABD2A6